MTNKEREKLSAIFSKAYDMYRKGLSAYASYKINNSSRGEDLVQETFLKAWEYIIKGKKINTMKAFLYHVLNDLIIDEYRKYKTLSLDGLLKKGFDPCVDESEHLINAYDGQRAIFLIRQLPKRYKKIVYLRYVKGMSLDEISNITKLTKNTIAVQVHRGLDKLKYLYNDFRN